MLPLDTLPGKTLTLGHCAEMARRLLDATPANVRWPRRQGHEVSAGRRYGIGAGSARFLALLAAEICWKLQEHSMSSQQQQRHNVQEIKRHVSCYTARLIKGKKMPELQLEAKKKPQRLCIITPRITTQQTLTPSGQNSISGFIVFKKCWCQCSGRLVFFVEWSCTFYPSSIRYPARVGSARLTFDRLTFDRSTHIRSNVPTQTLTFWHICLNACRCAEVELAAVDITIYIQP